MNKIFKTVFNKKTGQLVAVQETASAHGQGGSTVTDATTLWLSASYRL